MSERDARALTNAWTAFVDSIKALLDIHEGVRQPSRHSRFGEFRDGVIALAQDKKFIAHLEEAWKKPSRGLRRESKRLLLLELQSFPDIARMDSRRDSPGSMQKQTSTRLGWAATVVGSVEGILNSLPFPARCVLTLVKELLSLAQGAV